MRRTGWGQTKPPPGHRIDLGHPRNSHVKLIVPFNEAGGLVAFAAGPMQHVAWAPFGTFGPWQVTSRGVGLYCAGDTGFGFPSSPAFYTPNGVTVVSRCVFDLQSNFYAKNVAFGDDATWILGTNIGGSDVAGFRTWTAAGERTVTGATDVSDGTFHTVIGTSDGSTTRVYVDGRLDGTRTDSASTINTTTDSLCFGNSFNRNNDAAGVFVWFELHGRAWTPQEVAEYEDSPYDGLLPPRRNWWIGRAAASGGVTVAASVGTATATGALPAALALGATLTASVGTATADAKAGAVLISQTVAASLATATATGALPAALALGATLTASVGTATAAALAATVDTGSGNVSVAASCATATAAAPAPAVATGTTSTGAVGTATAAALAAGVVTGATISASVATATAQGRAATVTGGALVAGVVATATAAALAATVTAGSNGATVAAQVATATALALAGSVRIQGGFATLQNTSKPTPDAFSPAAGEAAPALGTRSKPGMAELT